MMTSWYATSAVVIFLAVVGGLVRVVYGPTRADRMLATQLFGTGGVAIVLLLAHVGGAAELVDVALVFALLSAVANIAFVRLVWNEDAPGKEVDHGAD